MANTGDDGGHSHGLGGFREADQRKLMLSLAITAAVMVLELAGGFLTNSLALISDAGHMFTHCFAIIIALTAIVIARQPPCCHRTYGMHRAEVLAAFTNGLFLLVVVAFVLWESIGRILHPEEVFGFQMLLVALIGLATNLASIYILRGAHKDNLNVRSVVYHMGADAAASVGVVAAAVTIMYTGWYILDPLVSVGISVLIVAWAIGILRESGAILLQTAPPGTDADTLSADLLDKFSGLEDIYNVHVWTVTTNMRVFTGHVRMKEKVKDPSQIVGRMNRYLAKEHGIVESTIQVDGEDAPRTCTLPGAENRIYGCKKRD
jgi:cobalt-zinc-cadmium efflux system protein